MTQSPQRCGFVALVGAPNAGKSTLLNQLVGSKLAIVTPKAQTTRNRIRGVCLAGATQIVFVDTPGLFAATERFDQALVGAAQGAVNEADAVMFIVDATHARGPAFEHALSVVKGARVPVSLVLNKVDATPKTELLELAAKMNALHNFAEIFFISARNGDGVPEMVGVIAGRMPESVWLYPEDQMTDITERMLAAEITREALLFQLQEEVPHQLWVETEQFKEAEDGVLELHQVIVVSRESHKMIVLGKKGSRIQSVGIASRKELRRVLGRPVRLALFVKVDEKWRDRPDVYRAFGLQY